DFPCARPGPWPRTGAFHHSDIGLTVTGNNSRDSFRSKHIFTFDQRSQIGVLTSARGCGYIFQCQAQALAAFRVEIDIAFLTRKAGCPNNTSGCLADLPGLHPLTAAALYREFLERNAL